MMLRVDIIWKDKKDIAQSLSTFVNAAYQGLAGPLSRAEYILERNGHSMSETDQLEDLDFISEVMEARETLDEATDENSVEQLARENDCVYLVESKIRFIGNANECPLSSKS
jgi:DnaJ-domain-containing protein 1